ncbi:hypothetical protein TCAL_15820 [Tigriopus californicus]|uniref:Uncharacterized protein n=1 Tax=Tigriopus californicus TaxID=6832 RepID=A0A553NPM3_TIGCA|nr:hypothetical protein TCAL_15820 [Tigriopus californicus]
MYKLVQTINSTKFRTEPFEDFYEQYEEIGRRDNDLMSGPASDYATIEQRLETSCTNEGIITDVIFQVLVKGASSVAKRSETTKFPRVSNTLGSGQICQGHSSAGREPMQGLRLFYRHDLRVGAN